MEQGELLGPENPAPPRLGKSEFFFNPETLRRVIEWQVKNGAKKAAMPGPEKKPLSTKLRGLAIKLGVLIVLLLLGPAILLVIAALLVLAMVWDTGKLVTSVLVAPITKLGSRKRKRRKKNP